MTLATPEENNSP